MTDSRDRRPASETPSFENLEQRMLLSGDGPTHGSVMWRGAEVDVIRDSWVVTFSESFEDVRAEAAVEFLSDKLGVQLTNFERLGLGHSARMDVEGRIRPKRVDNLTNDFAWLKSVDPNATYQPARVPNDPGFPDQWQHENNGQFVGGVEGVVGADANLLEAWDVTTGSIDTVVAVIDTGVDLDHPDLEANIWVNTGEIPGNGIDDDGNGFTDDVNGWDFGENDNSPDDVAGHGTGVAGTIAAVGNNDTGVAGVMWTGSILPLKIADRFGALSLAAIVGAHDYLTLMRGRGVNIVASNNSYGAFAPVFFEDDTDGFIPERDAIQRFIDSGGVFVASAGNDSNDNDGGFTAFPAAYDLPGIIAVAASDNTDSLSGFSNFGAETVDLAAPGTLVRTTQIGGGYASVSGTSFSGPMVAGAVGLLRTLRPGASGAEVRQILIDSSRPVPSLQNRVQSGGVLDVAEALRILDLDGPVITTVDPGPVTGQLDANGDPRDQLTVLFNKDLDPAFIDAGFVSLVGSGNDNVPIESVTLQDARTLQIQLDLLGFLQQRLPVDNYQLTLNSAGFRDLDGNFLNGNGTSGEDEVYDFEVVRSTGTLEPNDTLGTAERLNFTASGSAQFSGLTLGDGVRAGRDVDLFAITIPRGGLIHAEITAQNRSGGSTLDSYLRLFDGLGNEISANDQFNGQDSLIDFFVSTGGIYYIGVSGFPNTQYNPNVAGSGVTQSTGVYDLTIDIELIENDRVTATENLTANPARLPPQGSQGVFSTAINFADTREIRDLNVRLDILHEFDSDLQISLISPAGTTALLVDRHGGSGDNFESTLLDDEASVPIADGDAPFDRQGGYTPDEALSVFDGESAGGTWTLVINDTKSLDTGFLLNWSLDFTLLNNIFGAFESNDTIPTATVLTGIDGSGAAQFQANVGDGGFGGLDRDLFRFDASAGATLNVTATSDGILDTALQLFDSEGNRLRLSNPSGENDSIISNFVFNSGGTFYLGVSESRNVNYDPFDVTTGTASATTGAYFLDLSLTAGVSDDPRILDGTSVDLGVGANGTFLAGEGLERTGLEFANLEFLFDEAANGSPMHFYGASAGGSVFRNGGGTGNSVPISLTDQSDLQNQRLSGQSTFNGLLVDRSTSFGIGDDFVAVDVVITNISGQRINDLLWMEAFNPEQGLNLLQGTTASTANDVLEDGGTLPAGIASFSNNLFPDGLSIMLAAPSAESRAQLTFFDPTRDIRDPSVLIGLGVNDPNGTTADQAMGLTYDLGDLSAGQTTTMRYFLLMGESESDALALYDAINDGTGTGHLAADPSTPATEQLFTAPGDNNDEAATLPYRVYYPEGFANGKTSTFVPILNPHNVSNRVQVIARYEFGDRDQIISEEIIPAGERGGVTITTPEIFAEGNQLVRARTPYAIEIRSQLPVAANFSHYDLFLLTDGPAAVGEAFTNQLNDVFTFGEASKGSDVSDFLLYMNVSDQVTKVTTTFFPTDGGQVLEITQTFQPFRRGGLSLAGLNGLPNGDYGVRVEADTPIVASLTHFDRGSGTAYGVVGTPGGGDIRGAIPEGQIGLNSIGELIGVLNPNNEDADVLFSFIFQNGTTYRTALEVGARSRAELDVLSLQNFPVGQPYSIFYEVQGISPVPVSLVLPTQVFGDEFASSFSDQAFTLWGFGEGFRPRREGKVTEFLRLFNPSDDDVAVEITIHFDGGLGSETFRSVLPGRRVQEFDVHDFVTGDRRDNPAFYGLTVKAADPIVAYMGHFDSFFPGGFGTLGTPLGASTNV